MPYVSTITIIETRGHKVRIRRIRKLHVRNRFRLKRKLHVKNRFRKSILNRKIKIAGRTTTRHSTGSTHLTKKGVPRKKYVRKAPGTKRPRGVHKARVAKHIGHRHAVRKGFHVHVRKGFHVRVTKGFHTKVHKGFHPKVKKGFHTKVRKGFKVTRKKR